MKKIFTKIALLLMLVFALPQAETYAQPGRRMERVHALKVAYITDHVNLTSEQAEKFWPIYDNYEDEIRKIRLDFRTKYKDQQQQNPEEARNFIEDNLDYQEAILNLKKKYKNQFLKVISPQQLSSLLLAEREFKKMLLQQLQDRRRKR